MRFPALGLGRLLKPEDTVWQMPGVDHAKALDPLACPSEHTLSLSTCDGVLWRTLAKAVILTLSLL